MHARYGTRRALPAQALGLFTVLGALVPATAGASQFQVHMSGYGFPDTSAFDLHIVREDLEADYDDSAGIETLRLRRVGVAFYEALNESSRIGVRLGRAGFSQSGRAATAGFDPSGWFAELAFDGGWPANSRLQAALGASWRYTSVDDHDETDEIELDWQTLELRPALRFALTARLGLTLGASAIAVDGSELFRGSGSGTRTTTDFSAADAGGAFATLAYHRVDRDVVTLRLRGGNPQGLYVAFEHRY